MSCYLITGGAGFIGSNIAKKILTEKGNYVRILDNLKSGYLRNINLPCDRVEFIEGDILDEALVKEVTKGVDYILHHAAVTSVTDSFDYPHLTNSVNIEER